MFLRTVFLHQVFVFKVFLTQELTLFPLSQYLNVTNRSNANQYLCQQYDESYKCCNCDDNCFFSRTCCIDKLWNVTQPLPLKEYLEMFVNVSKSFKEIVCERIISFEVNSNHTSEELWMVRSCKEGAEVKDVQRCLNNSSQLLADNLPVLGYDKTLYRNEACARCNFASSQAMNLLFLCDSKIENKISITLNITTASTNFKTTKPTSSTGYSEIINDILDYYKNCTVSIIRSNENNNYVSGCFNQKRINADSCQKTNPHYDLCKAYSGRFSNYENYDCYKCNHENINNADKTFSKVDELFFCRFSLEIENQNKSEIDHSRMNATSIAKKSVQKVEPENAIYFMRSNLTAEVSHFIKPSNVTWYFTLDFSHKVNDRCGLGLSYDIVTSSCEPISCCFGYSSVGSQCFSFTEGNDAIFIERPSFENCLGQKAGLFLLVNDWENFEETNETLIYLKNNSQKFLYQKLTKENAVLYQLSEPVSIEMLQSVLRGNMSLFESRSLFITSVYTQRITELYGFDVARSFSNNKLCSQPEELSFLDGNFSKTCDFLMTNKVIERSNLILWIKISGGKVVKKMGTCKRYHLRSNCVLQRLPSNYAVDTNQTVIYRYLNEYYKFIVEQYEPIIRGVGVCKSSFMKSINPKLMNNVEYFISIVGTSISVACYLLILITYTYFEELRLGSNVNSTVLCVFLLFSDTTFLVSSHAAKKLTICRYSSMVLHWSLLAVYHWVLYMAIDLTMKFATYAQRKSNHHILLASILFSVLIPTAIVAVAIGLDVTGTIFIGYGENGYCWIVGRNAKIFFYILPVSVILFSAFFCLSFTTYKIWKVDKANKIVLGEKRTSSVNIVMVAIKLTLIFGITEILGFIQISKETLSDGERTFNRVISLLFTCCRSSKGAMLLMVYICTKKVIKINKRTLATLRKRFQQGVLFI